MTAIVAFPLVRVSFSLRDGAGGVLRLGTETKGRGRVVPLACGVMESSPANGEVLVHAPAAVLLKRSADRPRHCVLPLLFHRGLPPFWVFVWP